MTVGGAFSWQREGMLASMIVISLVMASGLQSSHLSYQVHSYDDHNEWDALLSKGVEWLKVDTHFVPPSKCHLFPFHQCGPDGMILLSHDDPTTHNVEYSSANDLLRWLTLRQPQLRGFHIALCGKGAPSSNASRCATDRAWQHYFGMYDSFIGKLQGMQKGGLDVDFILDGDLLVWGDCYENRWLPWNATWDDNPVLAYESNEGAYARLQVFDVPSPGFDVYALSHYGKFSRQSKYPYLVWEPSDQGEISKISSAYLKHGLHEPTGLRFAINIPPERFQVFNAQFSGTAWNVQLPGTQDLAKPFAFPVVSDKCIAVFAWNASCSCVVSSSWTYTSWFSAVHPLQGSEPVRGSGIQSLKSLQSVTRINDTSFLACDHLGTSTIVTLVSGATIAMSGAPFQSGSPTASQVFWAESPAWVLEATPPSCLLSLSGNNSFPPRCIVPATSSSLPVVDASFVVMNDGEVAVSWADSSKSIFVALLLRNGSLMGNIGVGTSASISYDNNTNNGALLVSATDSFCCNNEFNNKEVVNVCAMSPVSCPGVLAYWYAPVANWKQALGARYQRAFTVCDPGIAHGAFDNGSQGRSTLFWDAGRIRFLDVHVGANDSATQYPLCGMATPYAGLVLDSFDVSNYKF